ncbi:MAG: sigma-E processing peptidase SpoIIGA [Firmicutes bacterium]|nr:sigma-E processing peptidase SpoIIGA [Bacillota bacterium]
MAGQIVYLDQFVLGNFTINYLILWAASKVSRVNINKLRLLLGAALGAAYSLAVFLPGQGVLLAIYSKLAASVLIALAAAFPMPVKKFFTYLAVFYLVSFTLGGMVFGFIFFLNSSPVFNHNGVGTVVHDYFWPGLFIGVLVFYAAGKGTACLLRGRALENILKMALVIKFGGKQVKVDALMDTGNQLVDPLTGQPVIVVEYSAVKPILPLELEGAFPEAGEPDVWSILGSLGESRWAGRFSAVPFNSLGRTGGFMVGFRPDEVLVEQRGHLMPAKKTVVAICHKKLDTGSSYSALLHPHLLESVF